MCTLWRSTWCMMYYDASIEYFTIASYPGSSSPCRESLEDLIVTCSSTLNVYPDIISKVLPLAKYATSIMHLRFHFSNDLWTFHWIQSSHLNPTISSSSYFSCEFHVGYFCKKSYCAVLFVGRWNMTQTAVSLLSLGSATSQLTVTWYPSQLTWWDTDWVPVTQVNYKAWDM